MCGIAGIINKNFLYNSDLESPIRKMCASLIHRGPENSGFWIDNDRGVALGHQRLSILELSNAGNQPMQSFNSRFVISFNGEIYNHLEIRKKLESEITKGFKWVGLSDTETLLRAFEVWDVKKTLKICSGMFSIALWDKQKKKLTLARDRFGEKPLYFGWINEDFVFASEIKALKTYPNFNNQICKNALSDYLRFNYVPSPKSIYEKIYKLKPGTFIEFDESVDNFKKIKFNSFWSLENVIKDGQKNLMSETEMLNELEKRLSNSVKSQMLSDVPLGAFLSGGIDSSLIVSLMQQEKTTPIKTFTVGFEDSQFDESKYAKAVSNHLGTDHSEIFVSDKESQDAISLLPEIYDEPFADSSQIPTYLICKAAKQEVTVALSGDGGDEIFGGYNRYTWCPRIWNKVTFLPYSLRIKFAKFTLTLSERSIDKILNRFVDRAGFKIHKISRALDDAESLEDFMTNMTTEWKHQKGLILNTSNNSYNYISLHEQRIKEANLNFEDSVSRMMYIDSVTYLQDDILCKLDRAAMSNSLETRVPFLDEKVVDFAWKIPMNTKIKGNIGKWPLRKILEKYVPEKLIDRPKAGFSIPIGCWLRGPLKDWAENLLSEKRLDQEGNFSSKIIRNTWNQHLSGSQDYSSRLWGILMFQAWYEKQKHLN